MIKSQFAITSFFLCLVGACIALGISQPYPGDWVKYLWWRVSGPAVQDLIIASDDAKIRFQVVGTGPPVVLMHGGLSSSIDWYAQLPVLSKQFKLILIDQRGHGRSTLGKQPLSYLLHANDVVRVLDALALLQVDIVGWSDGGNIGLVIAKNYPQRVKRLVAISANAFPDGLTDEARASIEDIDPERPSIFARLLYRIQSPEPWKLCKLTGNVVQMWQNHPSLTLQNLNNISAPVLLIIGEQDDISLQHAQYINAAISNSTLRVVENIGHNVPQAASEKITLWVQEFLQRRGR